MFIAFFFSYGTVSKPYIEYYSNYQTCLYILLQLRCTEDITETCLHPNAVNKTGNKRYISILEV